MKNLMWSVSAVGENGWRGRVVYFEKSREDSPEAQKPSPEAVAEKAKQEGLEKNTASLADKLTAIINKIGERNLTDKNVALIREKATDEHERLGGEEQQLKQELKAEYDDGKQAKLDSVRAERSKLAPLKMITNSAPEQNTEQAAAKPAERPIVLAQAPGYDPMKKIMDMHQDKFNHANKTLNETGLVGAYEGLTKK